jgi:DNA modification methylase
MIRVLHGDCLDVLATLPDASVDACVTDPPYHLGASQGRRSRAPEGMYATMRTGFMGKEWDGGGVAFDPDTWRAVLRVLRPGAHMLCFGGTRTSHRLACAIEDAGFSIRDTLCWLYGSGFPKSHDVSKAIDKAAGAAREVIGFDDAKARPNRDKHLLAGQPGGGGKFKADNGATITAPATPEAQQWEGWGTALKPAFEPIFLARKPLGKKTVAANVLAHGCGAINVDACRIAASGRPSLVSHSDPSAGVFGSGLNGSHADGTTDLGRWPANVLHDGSEEVLAAFPNIHGAGAQRDEPGGGDYDGNNGIGFAKNGKGIGVGFKGFRFGDAGSAARFFYSAKADASDRADSKHPTVKPVDLLRHLVRLITPHGGTVLDPFAGSGTTGEAAMLEGFDALLIERDAQHVADIRHRIDRWSGLDAPLFASAAP